MPCIGDQIPRQVYGEISLWSITCRLLIQILFPKYFKSKTNHIVWCILSKVYVFILYFHNTIKYSTQTGVFFTVVYIYKSCTYYFSMTLAY